MLLSIPEEHVEIEIGEETRNFKLVQQSIRRGAKLLVELDRAVELERNAKGEKLSLEVSADQVAESVEHILVDILIPLDGLGPLTLEQARGLVLDHRLAILDKQQQLNRFEELIPNVLAIVMEIHTIRMARTIVDGADGMTSSTSSEPATESTPLSAPTDGPVPKASAFTDLLSETAGDSIPSQPVAPEPTSEPNPTGI